MGGQLLRQVVTASDLQLVGAVEAPGHELVGSPVSNLLDDQPETDFEIVDDSAEVLQDGRVLIDFTRPAGTRSFLDAAHEKGGSLVIGTTGLEEEDLNLIEQVSEQVPIVRAPNMSVGINLLTSLVREATACLGEEFDVEITETHHRHKEDAPSGTARLLAKQVARERRLELDEAETIGREGFVGERSYDEIGIHSLRGGDVVGDHTVLFAGEGERVELTHKASSRETFARGALRAARFLDRHDRGLFSMKDVLGL